MTRIIDVIDAVAREFEVTPGEIRGSARGDQPVIRARLLSYLLAHEITGRSYGVIGGVLGRTREGVLLGSKSARERLEVDADFAARAARVRSRLAP